MTPIRAVMIPAWLTVVAVPPLAAQRIEPRCPAAESRRFDFWIGDWNVVNRNRRPDGVQFFRTGTATDRVYAVVGGCAVVEHWRGSAIGRFIVGFSVRAFDPADGEWDLVLLWPTTGEPSFGILHGGFRHGRGEFFTPGRVTPQGDTVINRFTFSVINRFTFSDIGPDALRWENGTSRDGGRSYAPGWIMEFTRRDPVTDGGLGHGVAVTIRRCPGTEHRAFDESLGEWNGTRVRNGEDTVRVRVRIVPILEGCAAMERAWAADGSWEAFRVRAWEPARERWVEYAIDTERPVLVRREAAAPRAGQPIAFQDVEPRDGVVTRSVWSASPSEIVITVSAASAPDGPWRTRSVLRLTERVEDPHSP